MAVLASPTLPRGNAFTAEASSIALGVFVTLALFYAIAQFKGDRGTPIEAITDLHPLALSPEPPPKNPVVTVPVEIALPFAGLEVAASDSPIKIAVLPPDLDTLVPKTRIPPAAVIQTTRFFSELKPRVNLTAELQHVFQPSEVDQRTTVLSRPDPQWPRGTSKDIHTLRVTFMLVVNTNGSAESIRLIQSSGIPAFDHDVEAQIRDSWIFSPALKNGRKVRCLVQQLVAVSAARSSPYRL